MFPRHPLVLPIALLALGAAGCGAGEDDEAMDGDAAAGTMPRSVADTLTVRSAMASMSPTEGNQVGGSVTFTGIPGGLRIEADLMGLGEEGERGFHLHETGDCSAPDGSSAGGHFAPEGSAHGGPDQSAPDAHAGDLGNLEVDAEGHASFSEEFLDLTLDGSHGVVGRAVIVHAGTDDLESQPSGDAGERMACGVVRDDMAAR